MEDNRYSLNHTNTSTSLPDTSSSSATNTPTNPAYAATTAANSQQQQQQRVSATSIDDKQSNQQQNPQQQARPESLNLTSNNSSVSNLVISNASQGPDTSSIQTNNSSDCVITYDSDSTNWPLSQVNSSSKINNFQLAGSASRLDGQACAADEENFSSCFSREEELLKRKLLNESDMNKNFNKEADERESRKPASTSSGPDFLVGSADESNDESMIFISKLPLTTHDLELRNSENNKALFDNDPEYQDDDDDSEDWEPHKQVIVGICAMEKKAQSKPMREILKRLEDYFEFIRTLIFDESVILNKPIEEWPLCDCLISFHSKGFPLSKAIEYARLRKPFLVNDLDIQYDIQDRRKVYKILEEADIELPRYAVLDRDSANPEERDLIESDDHIEVSNFIFNKPFVEKPISAEDHNICIYYPAHAGGGSQRLFRKIGCRSSVYSNESHVRKTGSYIYEEFMPTDGTDVKVYTAGPDYAHAEARKSPALDGKVERDMDGKEIRYPVILTNREKLIARKVCLAFKQTVCGFDLLRANGRSYVCDVNGFSFVKSSMKYYEDCSKIMGNMMLRALAPQLHIPWSIPFQLDDPPIVPTTFGRMMELRCVVAIIRHGDRTPKQKMKLEVKHPKFFELYQKYGNTKNGQAKLKKPKQLQEVLDIARYLLGEMPEDQPLAGEVIEPRVKLKQLKSVLEMYGHFSGINRKVQLKYQPHGRPRRSSSEDEATREPSLVLILKWGGELTPAGRVQAEDLGRCFRRLYPASGDYSGPQGLGLLRLHSTFRHDLKIYASDEGRVQMTAAAFAKGFLALEGELTPILFQMVKSANTNGLLDNDCDSSKCQKIVKERLHDIMQKNYDLTEEDMEILNPTNAPSIAAACKFIGNPYQACEKVHKLIKELNSLIRSKRQDNGYTQEYHLYHGETWDLLQRRWAKLEKDFKFKRSKRFDISKIPDIYDCIKYDLQHNQHTLQFQFAHEMHAYAKALADIVIPQEYGMTSQEKLMISLGTCSPLLRKIQADLIRNADSANGEDESESVNRLDPKYSHGVSSPDRHVRTRLYFTSESHIHSLVTALQYGGLVDAKSDEQWQRSMEFLSAISELNYLSQIVIMLYEDPTKEPTSDDRFHVEIHFSSGVINRITQQNMPTEPQGPGFRPHLHNKSYSNASATSDSTPIKDPNSLDPQQAEEGSTTVVRSRLSSLNMSGKQKESMIREEPADEERSGEDADSRANSKGSSSCMTPKKSSIEQKISSGSFDEKSKGKILTKQSNISNQPLSAKQQRCLSRSYSANTPISLQDVFKKTPEYMTDLAVTNENATNDGGEEVGSSSARDETIPVVSDDKQDKLDTDDDPDKTKSPLSETVRSRATMVDMNKSKNVEIIKKSSPTANNRHSLDDDVITEDQMSPMIAAKFPEKNNWKTYEQYLATELSNTPHLPQHQHHHYHHRRRHCSNQNDHQSVNLTPTYHTIHSHWNFSSPGNNFVPKSSISMSTSPQQTVGANNQATNNMVNIHQRYLAHKQAQQSGGGGKQFFTMSASMPIQYKSNQNPRACSVADVSQYCGGPSLISTAVISGSSPELVAVCPYSPNIRPLETLHNELSLKPFIDFITKLTRNHRSSIVSHVDGNHQNISCENIQGASSGNNMNEGSLMSSNNSLPSTSQIASRQQRNNKAQSSNAGNKLNATPNNGPGLSPGNSLSNSLIWSGPPSSFASSPGPSSPGAAALELWSKLEIDEEKVGSGSSSNGGNENNQSGVISGTASSSN